ncbi:MAG: YlbF family regulator [Lachnospiraceae bacterium]|nr:YlbF family regulator [Lachnospiraceae bacterium]
MIMQEAKRLNQIIRESEEYTNYVRTMKRVKENE